MNETIGLPKLKIAFEAAAQAVANRAKKGYVGLVVRDEKAQGLHKLSSDTMIPLELGEANKAHIKTAFDKQPKLFAIITKDELERLIRYGGDGGALC